MERIIHGIHLTGERISDSWDVTVWENQGHREISVRQAIQWTETIDMGFDYKLDDWDPVKDAAALEERRLRSIKKSAQRAKTECRRIIKSEGFNELLTITYRENQGDRELCKKHFKEWVRRMKRALPDFRFCASFERQDRGCMHVHLATHKLPVHAAYKGVKIEAWKLGTKVWRSIVGEDNGLVYVGGLTKFGKGRHRKMSLAKMAAYISKYILKDCEDVPSGSNRYSRSDSIDVPKPTHIRFDRATLAEVIACIFEVGSGDVLVDHRVGFFKDSYWCCTEPLLQ